MPTVLVTGANRGLGIEFVRQYLADGWEAIATCRDPDGAAELKGLSSPRLAVLKMDVTEPAEIQAAARALGDRPIDVLLNNAGYEGPLPTTLGALQLDEFRRVLATNTIGPLAVAEAFFEAVRRSERKLLVTISSRMGSIGRNKAGGSYFYRASKAGVNAALRSLAIDIQGSGVAAVMIHPGVVHTGMGGPHAHFHPPESVAAVRRAIAGLSAADNGRFLNYDGSDIPW